MPYRSEIDQLRSGILKDKEDKRFQERDNKINDLNIKFHEKQAGKINKQIDRINEAREGGLLVKLASYIFQTGKLKKLERKLGAIENIINTIEIAKLKVQTKIDVLEDSIQNKTDRLNTLRTLQNQHDLQNGLSPQPQQGQNPQPPQGPTLEQLKKEQELRVAAENAAKAAEAAKIDAEKKARAAEEARATAAKKAKEEAEQAAAKAKAAAEKAAADAKKAKDAAVKAAVDAALEQAKKDQKSAVDAAVKSAKEEQRKSDKVAETEEKRKKAEADKEYRKKEIDRLKKDLAEAQKKIERLEAEKQSNATPQTPDQDGKGSNPDNDARKSRVAKKAKDKTKTAQDSIDTTGANPDEVEDKKKKAKDKKAKDKAKTAQDSIDTTGANPDEVDDKKKKAKDKSDEQETPQTPDNPPKKKGQPTIKQPAQDAKGKVKQMQTGPAVKISESGVVDWEDPHNKALFENMGKTKKGGKNSELDAVAAVIRMNPSVYTSIPLDYMVKASKKTFKRASNNEVSIDQYLYDVALLFATEAKDWDPTKGKGKTHDSVLEAKKAFDEAKAKEAKEKGADQPKKPAPIQEKGEQDAPTTYIGEFVDG